MKTVIEMAGQAFETPGTEPAFRNGFWTVTQEELERFAALVRADERERWAKFCETHIVWVGGGKRGLSELSSEELVNGGVHQGMDYAAAIRARGETHDA